LATGQFPRFSESDIREGVKEAEGRLATEIINAYSSAYPNAGKIIDVSFKGCDMVFKGSELDRRAKEGASEWPSGSYSRSTFREMVAELGVVGRVLRRNDTAGFIDAEFEYSKDERLTLTSRDECVIHPMFYRRLGVNVTGNLRIMPFSTDREGR
jgi:hypothetical protein